MEKVSKFLGADGLTSTSANHIANIAKEMYEALETKIQSLRLYNKDYTLALNGKEYRVENESSKEELFNLADSIKEVSSLKSLIAWLREGIKAKENLTTKEAEEDYIEKLIKEGRKELDDEIDLDDCSFETVLGEMGEETMARYYALEAKCATLGKFIHPDGSFALARKSFFNVTKNPTTIQGKGQDAEIHTFSTSFTAEEVDKEFFELQKRYRSLQAELNKLKAEVDNKYKEELTEQLRVHRIHIQECDLARKEALLERSKEIKALKIVIPQSLKEIFDKVNAVASAK